MGEFFAAIFLFLTFILFALTLFIFAVVLRGWVLSILWGWFMVPVFGLPHLSVVQAIGVAMVVGFLCHENTDTKKNEEKGFAWSLSMVAVIPLLSLFIGWIIHSFM